MPIASPPVLDHTSTVRAEAPAKSRTVTPLGVPDAISLALFAAVLFALAYLQSRNKMFWGDEIMGNYVLHAGSWHRFVELWSAGIDSSGFWFYVFAKPWEWLLGASQMRLRMFSATGVVTSAILIWITARRFFRLPEVAVAVAVPFLNLGVLRWQLANGRCYGVLLAATALVIFLIVKGADEKHQRPSVGFIVSTFLAYDVLAGSHILGMVYAGALLGIQIAIDLRKRTFRPVLYASALVGTVVIVVLSMPNIRSTTALGKPVFWTIKPLLRSYWFATPATEGYVQLTIMVLSLLAFLSLRWRESRSVVYFLLLGFLLLHSAFVFISDKTTSIYVDRYLLPMTFALVLTIAELLMQMREVKDAPMWRYSFVYACVWTIPLLFAPRPRQFSMPYRDYTDALLADLPSGLPVVDTDVGTFVEEEYYHHGHFERPFLFPLDQEVTNDLSNHGGVSGFHEMENFRRYGLDAPDLQSTEDILAAYPTFVVITAADPTSWFHRRVQGSNAFEVTDLGAHNYSSISTHFWLVRRRHA